MFYPVYDNYKKLSSYSKKFAILKNIALEARVF